MPILNENKAFQVMTDGLPSMTEKEHTERCNIKYQLKRMSKGLQPNWTGKQPVYGTDKMDNSLTDHRIELQKQYEKVAAGDLSALSEEDFAKLPEKLQKLAEKSYKQQRAKRKLESDKNDEKLKNDEKKQSELTMRQAEAIANALKPILSEKK